MSKLFSLRLERHLLAGLIKYPVKYNEVAMFLQPEDFGEPKKIHETIYRIIGILSSESSAIDQVIIGQRLTNLGVSFENGISVFDYMQSLTMQVINETAIVDVAKQVKRFSVRREIFDNASKIQSSMIDLSDDCRLDDIVSVADKIYNIGIEKYFNADQAPKNIFSDMEANVELRGENQVDEVGLMQPNLPRTNEMCGSLLRPGNITVVVSRYGVGKSTLAWDICSKTGIEYNVPVLHYDNGEMSYEEIQFRAMAAISGVPLYLIESGKWRNNPDTTNAVRATFKKMKNWKFYYFNVGGMDYHEMINIARRWYYSNVGRGKEMIWSYDYIKMRSLGSSSGNDFWAGIGEMLDTMKTFISKEIVYENRPMISMFSSVQANRLGISQGKNSSEVDDTEAVVGLSDMIGQLTSHLFLLRKKTIDELTLYGKSFGTHNLIHIKGRHMGKNPSRMFDPIKMPDGNMKKNFLHLNINNFDVRECGDLIDWCNHISTTAVTPKKDGKTSDVIS